ncbi:MAG TPA: S9 family peptidase [Steroidobacteraceae bacterium]|nr:S9 family peptidase [Steroidobacteraceae bacterium]
MNKSALAVWVVVGLGAVAASAVEVAPAQAPAPPVAERRPFDVVSPNGNRRDDYYWLRDDTRKSKDVLGYLEAENAYRDAYMAPSAQLTQKLYDELVARLKPDDASVPVLDREYFYYSRFVPGLDYAVYARRKGAMTAPEEVLLDGNAMAQGHSFFQIGATEVSPNGELLAYTEDDVGRRQYTLHIKNLKTGETLSDRIENVQPEFVWAADNRTLVYVEKDPVTLLSVRVRKHPLGAAQPDPLVYEEKDHSYYMGVRKSRSEKFLFIDLRSTQQTEVRYADAADLKLRFMPVLPREADLEYEVDHLGQNFIIRTNWRAPNFRIVRAPIATSADKQTWVNVIPAADDTYIEDFEVSKQYLAINERSGGLLKMRVKTWAPGKDTLIASEEPSYAASLVHTPGLNNSTVRYVFSSLKTPRTTYDYDMGSDKKHLKKTEAVLGGFHAANYRTEFLWVPARDGKRIPVSVVMRKNARLDGSAPLYQYGYGSYGYSTDPDFRSNWVSLLDRGFIVAIAHVRGGQELGRAWFEDGRLLNKKNSFTDFIDVTERLVALKYVAKDKVFASGGSAGGLLVGAVSNMAPQDYRGIIAYVPFVDAVTTMLDESIPLTSNEFDQWGNPKEKKYYDYILSYSPYDNVTAQHYPAMLVLTSLWDSQVQYYEPTKWVARLRATKTDHEPLVFSVNMAGGHGGKSGRFQRYHDTALEYAFILRQLGIAE